MVEMNNSDNSSIAHESESSCLKNSSDREIEVLKLEN